MAVVYGVKLSPEELMWEYKRLCKEAIEGRWEKHSEIKVVDIFARICRKKASWPINEVTVRIETARIFRSSSIRKLQASPQSIMLLETLRSYPQGGVSNCQRVFSENELKHLGPLWILQVRSLLLGPGSQEAGPQDIPVRGREIGG